MSLGALFSNFEKDTNDYVGRWATIKGHNNNFIFTKYLDTN